MPTKFNITSEFELFNTEEELNKDDRKLLSEAKKAMAKAYAPYSNFHVGAALSLENGKTVTGNNQENAAYPSGLCAERVAIFYAGAEYPGIKFKTIAIICKTSDNEPAAPCGACRQAIAEYESRQEQPIRILMAAQNGKIIISNGIARLLPLMFNRNSLT